jgi:exodeoxyribonuclease VII large subunit
MEEPRKIFTLTELGKSLRSVIERNYTSTYWIKAEIAKLNFYPRSGHCYPELVDKSGNVVQAQMRATIWAADFKTINKQFAEITGDLLREGMAILFRASVGYHPVYGLSLQIWEVEPAFTLGEMALDKARNIEKLRKEGIFDQNKQLTMPLLAQKLAVISVETSKGYSDFLKILHQHAGSYSWKHKLFPSVLQGDKAAEGIISQLRAIKKSKQKFDLVAIIRGGGGDIGLNCYDDYNLAHEIATFPLPVITGIGHATNETISEMVAWSNKITPTDVAYFIVDKFREFAFRIENATQSITNKTMALLSFSNQSLTHLTNKVERYPLHIAAMQKAKLDSMSSSLVNHTRGMQQGHQDQLNDFASAISLLTPRVILSQKHDLEERLSQLTYSAKQLMGSSRYNLENLDLKAVLLNPENVLKRGYSITQYNGELLKQAARVKPGDILITRLYEGNISSKVVEENPE